MLTKTVPEHILADERALCGTECEDADARVVHHERDPVTDGSLHLCHECANEWVRIEDDVTRALTVRCAVDRAEEGDIWTCCDVVSAEDARGLNHPDAEQPVPICPSCYEWLRDFPGNGVKTPYDEATPWGKP